MSNPADKPGVRRAAEAISHGLAERTDAHHQAVRAAAERVRIANAIHPGDAPGVRVSKRATLGLADAFEHLALAGADGHALMLDLAHELGCLFGGALAARGGKPADEAQAIEDLAAAFGRGAVVTAQKERNRK